MDIIPKDMIAIANTALKTTVATEPPPKKYNNFEACLKEQSEDICCGLDDFPKPDKCKPPDT